jgi:UDP-glucose 4-epimerase
MMRRVRHERVLITGAAGFIGSHLAERYLTEGAAVFGVDNLVTGSWDNFPVKHANYAELDVADREALYKFANVSRPDLIVHCAASYADPLKWHRDAETNVLGSINTAIAANHHEAKLVYFNTALPPISSYAISKIAGEEYIRMAVEDALVFRLANIYGPRNLSGPIPTFYRRLLARQPCTVMRTFRELVYVGDLVDAVITLVEQERAGRIDICTGEWRSIRDLYDAVVDAMGIDPDDDPEELEPGDDDVVAMQLDPHAAALLGWEATTPLQVGIRAAVDWYSQHGVGATYTHLRTR